METKRVIPLFRSAPTERTDDSTPKRMAAYCRVSSDKDEQLNSLSAQKEYYEKALTEDANYDFVGIYADEGISGTQVNKREGFLQMMEDCRSGKIDGIITKSVSRFGRNTVDTLVYTRELRSLGIDVFFEKEDIHSINAVGELLLTLISALSQNESTNLSDNVKWGVHRKYEIGEAGSLPLGKFYGYSQKKRVITINEDEATVVRRIYAEYLSGRTPTQIAERLTADGIPTERGNEFWHLSVVRKILRNEKYKGDTLFQKTFIADPITHKRVKNNGVLPQFYSEDSIPAIVERDVWELTAAEQHRRENYCKEHSVTIYRPGSEEFPLSGRLVCQTCGHTYVLLESKVKSEKGKKHWRCSSFHGGNGTSVNEMEFIPRGQPLRNVDADNRWVKYYRRNKRKLPQPRQMLCTDIEVEAGKPEKAFIRAWNLLVSKKQRYQATLKRTADTTDDILLRYRATELIRILDEMGIIKEFNYAFSLAVLEKIEVTPQGKLTVCFLGGVRLTV